MPRLRPPVPWLVILEAAWIARDHWGKLPVADRRELARIVRKSRGLPQNLTADERRELRRLIAALEPLRAGRRLLPFGGGARKRRH